jgi:hypothetical protein
VTAEVADAAVADLNRGLEPAGEALAIVELRKALVIWPVPSTWQEAAPLYVEALSDLPPDLLIKAMKRAVMTLKFFPRPVEIRDQVSAELSERRRMRSRAELIATKARREAAMKARRAPPAAAPLPSKPFTVPKIKVVDKSLDDMTQEQLDRDREGLLAACRAAGVGS